MENYSNLDAEEFRILIVEDAPENIDILIGVLSNYNLIISKTGEKALKLMAGDAQPDLVLLDIELPNISGYSVCNQIRQNKEYDDIPIVFLTSKTDRESILKGFETGGQDYITKPFDTKELLARVKTHIELKKNKEQLKNVNRWLENKVAQRTEELKGANNELIRVNSELEKLNKELINLDKEKAEFLSIISHEIRTPLNGLIGFLDIIKSSIDDEKILEYFNYIDISTSRLEKFALLALQMTQLKVKNLKLDKLELNLNDIILGFTNSKFGEELSQKKISTNFDFSPQDMVVYVDESLFHQCISCVYENAISYTNEGSTIEIRGFLKDNYSCIEFVDEGPGFSEKALNNLFKPFIPGIKHVDENMGLDLAVVNLIIEEHGGKIEIENQDKKGALVRLLLPAKEAG
ncbi:hybrid sensor histidine kinase/response regulator [Maribellus maritimus]|uniref:hybrid sensor histidine kinase/response regulator n=1 Tax=Maribellus maritimus TaxID=2870838 RepID=UPI001EE9CD96|nr:hybrid sensor histidine kinase/response regulator [Maribellus maritimus]MCG6189424.1 hybrid sensor histidine kinase/response regulator [Maribellus maritimus]